MKDNWPPQFHEAPLDVWLRHANRLTDARRLRLLDAAAKRTDHIRLVVQDVHHPHNVSACLRSAEAFGLLSVDVVLLEKPFKPSTVARGVKDWLLINKWQDIEQCARNLKELGYIIAVGMPDQNAVPLESMPTDQKIAVIFGNEHEGVHPAWKPFVDIYFTIPMAGLVESLNISVSAALTLRHLRYSCEVNLPKEQFYLPKDTQDRLLSVWLYRQMPYLKAIDQGALSQIEQRQ